MANERREGGGPPQRSGRSRRDPAVLAAIALGGAIGAPARYGVSGLVHVEPGSFPWGTFLINVSGSFALGVVLVVLLERLPPSRFARPFVATGFLGAYTTYSTFAVETVLLAKDGHAGLAGAYAVAGLVTGFAAVGAGIVLGRRFGRAR